jgi:hypothetical protein
VGNGELRTLNGGRKGQKQFGSLHDTETAIIVRVHAAAKGSDLPGTDEFIERCERVRAWNYGVRAAAQARLAPPVEPAGTATFGSAQLWFAGTRARVHLFDQASLDQLPAIEAWFTERKLEPLFDVLPVIANRPVTSALGERGYRLVCWQPTLYRSLSLPIDGSAEAVEVEQVGAEDAEFRETYLGGRGYQLSTGDHQSAAAFQEASWNAEGALRFIARIDGKPVAAATLVVFNRVARLANCYTLAAARNRGAQAALIRARLRWAASAGHQLAVSDARQGGAGLRNLARAGFAIGAHITQWRRANPTT